MFGFFKKKKDTLLSPMAGKSISIKEVPDETFSSEMLGKGVAIIPSDGLVTSPVNGTVSMIFDTLHAVSIIADTGEEVLIHDRMGLLLPDSEAGFIALHFVNAQYSTHMKETLSLPHLMRDIMDIVMSELNVNLNENSIHYERFVTHIKFLIQRLYHNEMLLDEDTIFEDMMKEKYPREFECGKRIAKYIEHETKSEITRMEMTYLAIHIKRVTMSEE